jgi:hypothetical protein
MCFPPIRREILRSMAGIVTIGIGTSHLVTKLEIIHYLIDDLILHQLEELHLHTILPELHDLIFQIGVVTICSEPYLRIFNVLGYLKILCLKIYYF